MKKLVDTKFKDVRVTFRNPNEDSQSIFVGGNDVVIDGKRELKQYRLQPGEVVSLPEPFIEQLRDRYYIVQDKDNNTKKIPIYFVEMV